MLSRGGKWPRIEMDHIRARAEAKSRPARARVSRRGTYVRYEIVRSLTGDAPELRRHCAPASVWRKGADAERAAQALDIPRKLRPVEARSVWGALRSFSDPHWICLMCVFPNCLLFLSCDLESGCTGAEPETFEEPRIGRRAKTRRLGAKPRCLAHVDERKRTQKGRSCRRVVSALGLEPRTY